MLLFTLLALTAAVKNRIIGIKYMHRRRYECMRRKKLRNAVCGLQHVTFNILISRWLLLEVSSKYYRLKSMFTAESGIAYSIKHFYCTLIYCIDGCFNHHERIIWSFRLLYRNFVNYVHLRVVSEPKFTINLKCVAL